MALAEEMTSPRLLAGGRSHMINQKAGSAHSCRDRG